MNRSAIRVLIVVASIFLVGLIFTQVTWVNKAYKIEEQQFSYNVTNALINVVEIIQKNANDSTPIYDPIEQVSANMYMVRIHDTLYPYFLESILKSEFHKLEINEPFQYSIYDCFSDSIVYQQQVECNKQETKNAPDFVWNHDDGHHFSVYFPNRANTITHQLDFWLYSSVFIIVVVFFFSYMIYIILKQRKLSEIKNDFINNMTHEFKTPISTIGLSSEVLLQDNIAEKPERIKNYARIIHQENKRLQTQVEHILQIATIEKEQINLAKKDILIHQTIEKAAETFRLNVEAKSGKIELDLKSTNDIVQGDEVHLFNIFSNLIDNAIKYSTESPLIKIHTEDTKNGIRICIADNGIGIAADQQKFIFEKFYRVPKGNVHDVKGFGIGLNYVKVMVEQHSGTIRLKSKLNQGSEFCIELPTH